MRRLHISALPTRRMGARISADGKLCEIIAKVFSLLTGMRWTAKAKLNLERSRRYFAKYSNSGGGI